MPGGYSTDYLRNLTVWGKTADQHKKIGGSISVRMDWDRVVSVQKGTVDFQTVSERKKKKEKKKKKKKKKESLRRHCEVVDCDCFSWIDKKIIIFARG